MSKLPSIQSPMLSALPHIQHGFFTRAGGVSQGIYESLNAGTSSHDDPASVKENRARVAKHFGGAVQLTTGKQTHSTCVARRHSSEPFDGDGSITSEKNLALGVLTADCAPILFTDRDLPLIAAVHAGWRGAVAGITDEALNQLRELGAKNIVAAIGPHISFAAYEVGADMRETCQTQDPRAEKFFAAHEGNPHGGNPHGGKFHFDLGGYLEYRLTTRGVQVEPTASTASCTISAPETFFSARGAGGADYGRQVSAILLR